MNKMNDTRGDNCVGVFAKYPEKGRVKTRLSAELGEDAAVDLYRCFTMDLLHTLESVDAKTCICFYPEHAMERFIDWLGPEYFYVQQQGKDLGERMYNAFLRILDQGFKNVLIIGSDSPDLPSELINKAFSALHKDDVVIGPTFDGGYYLFGFRKETLLPEAFQGIRWSTSTVYNDTLSVLKKHDYSIHVLSQWRDVDTLDDLRDCVRRNKDSAFRASKTMDYLMQREEDFR